MRVKDILRTEPVLTIRADDDLALATQTMLWGEVRHLPVVSEGEVVGVLSERDIFRRNAQRGPRSAARDRVAQVMRAPAVTIKPGDLLVDAVELMLNRKVGCLPVVDGGRLVGILTRSDLLTHQLATAMERPAERLGSPGV